MSGRIRSIKPEWIDSELFCSCSDASIRLAFVMLALVDDDGRVRISVRALGLRAWGFCDEIANKTAHARAALDGLKRVDWLDEYEVDGVACWQVRNFAKHQRIDKYKPSKLPPPPTSRDESRGIATTPDASRMVEPDQDQDQGSGSGSGEGAPRTRAHEAEPLPDPPPDVEPADRPGAALHRAYVAELAKRTARHDTPTPEKLGAAAIAERDLAETAALRRVTPETLIATAIDRWFADPWARSKGYPFAAFARQAAQLATSDSEPRAAGRRGNVAPPASHADHAAAVAAAIAEGRPHGEGWADVGI